MPTGPNKFDINSALEFYKPLNLEEDPFYFTKVFEKTISDFLKELKTNKATGIDNLSGRFLKDGSKVLATPITQICNLSIKLSTVPDECKIAKLKPLYKKGKKTDPKNYRPISLLPIISKILEKVIHDQTMDFVRDDTHMMSMKIVQFSRLPFSFTLLLYLISVTYVVQSSSTTLTLDIQFQRNPSPFPNYSQSIKRKLNPCMTILCYQVFPSGWVSFLVSIH